MWMLLNVQLHFGLTLLHGINSLSSRSPCEQNDNSDNDVEEENTNLSEVVRYQIRDEGESVV